MGVYFPIYLFDMHECEAAIEKPGTTFFQVAIGDEDSPGLAVPAAGDFPYGYDYTCEWDETLIYLDVRPQLPQQEMKLADYFGDSISVQVFGSFPSSVSRSHQVETEAQSSNVSSLKKLKPKDFAPFASLGGKYTCGTF